jgi:hypothetical protein
MIQKLSRFLVCLTLCVLSATVSAQTQPFIAVQNGVVGENKLIRISNLNANQNSEFVLTRPDQTRLNFVVQTDDFGVAQTTIHNLHTQQSGKYTLHIQKNGIWSERSFQMFPGSISSHTSEIKFDRKSLAANGYDSAQFEIIIRDAFGNPIANTPVQVISSRNTDTITMAPKTNIQGKVTGTIQSNTAGVSSLSVLAQKTVLFEKPQIVFYTAQNRIPNAGSSGNGNYGEYLRAQIFGNNVDTQAAYFVIEDLKQEAYLNETLSFTVVAKDINGDTVPTYLGTVRFNAPGDIDATLPQDYTFRVEDQGSHTFPIALSFGTVGEQKIEVHDLEDFRIAGEADINIVLGSSPVQPPQNPALRIITPQPGKHQTSQVTITGKATDVLAVRIVDGPYTLVENLQVDDDGNFVFQTPRLGDGVHIFQVFDMYSDLSSDSVRIEVDTTPPNSLSVSTNPAGPFQPGQEFELFVSADEELSTVSAIYQDVLTQLIPSENGYIRTLTAPLLPGEYPINIIASDILGNQIEENNALSIAVVESQAPFQPTPTPTPDPAAPTEPPMAPSSITNLHAKSGENKITLFWSPPSNGNIAQYRIEFAETELFQTTPNQEEDGDIGVFDELFNSLYEEEEEQTPDLLPLIDTQTNSTQENPIDPTTGEILVFSQFNITPDARTQWYVDNLQDDKKYFFRVVAIDQNGQQSTPSNIINELTLGAKRSLIPEKTPETGSDDTVIALLIALIGGGISMIIFKRKSI